MSEPELGTAILIGTQPGRAKNGIASCTEYGELFNTSGKTRPTSYKRTHGIGVTS